MAPLDGPTHGRLRTSDSAGCFTGAKQGCRQQKPRPRRRGARHGHSDVWVFPGGVVGDVVNGGQLGDGLPQHALHTLPQASCGTGRIPGTLRSSGRTRRSLLRRPARSFPPCAAIAGFTWVSRTSRTRSAISPVGASERAAGCSPARTGRTSKPLSVTRSTKSTVAPSSASTSVFPDVAPRMPPASTELLVRPDAPRGRPASGRIAARGPDRSW